jgi:hypothetical protein
VNGLKGFHGWDSFAHGRSLISLHQADELWATGCLHNRLRLSDKKRIR